jgi:hypothetical protein
VASPESDVTGATTIYYVPSGGIYVPIYDGTNFVARSIGAGLSIPLDSNSGDSRYHQSGINFDLYAYWDGSTVKLGTGYPWTANRTASTELPLAAVNGYLVNANSMILRIGNTNNTTDLPTIAANQATYLGTFTATANGQATDSKARRLLFNACNQIMRPMKVYDVAASWTYNTATTRQANANAANQLEFLLGLSGIGVEATINALTQNSTTAFSHITVFIGLDSTTAGSADATVGFTEPGLAIAQAVATYRGFPGLGRHVLTWLERGAGDAAVQTFYSTGTGGLFQSGMMGSFLG